MGSGFAALRCWRFQQHITESFNLSRALWRAWSMNVHPAAALHLVGTLMGLRFEPEKLDVEGLRNALPAYLNLIPRLDGEKRDATLASIWEEEGVPRSTRRAVLREIAGLSNDQIHALLRTRELTEETRLQAASGADPDEVRQAYLDMMNFLERISQ